MAIVERRDIEFDAEGLLKAVAASAHVASRFGLPSTAAAGVAFRPEQSSVDLVFGTESGELVVPLAAEALGALLVFFCMAERVPLPRGASKAVQVKPSAVVLKFRLALGPAPASAPPGPTFRPVPPMNSEPPDAP